MTENLVDHPINVTWNLDLGDLAGLPRQTLQNCRRSHMKARCDIQTRQTFSVISGPFQSSYSYSGYLPQPQSPSFDWGRPQISPNPRGYQEPPLSLYNDPLSPSGPRQTFPLSNTPIQSYSESLRQRRSPSFALEALQIRHPEDFSREEPE
jgi:hypothetical protein